MGSGWVGRVLLLLVVLEREVRIVRNWGLLPLLHGLQKMKVYLVS